MLVLTAAKVYWVLTTAKHEEPTVDAPQAEWDRRQKWTDDNEMAKCYILGSMSNVLQQQHVGMATSTEIMPNLKELFGEQNRTARLIAIKGLVSTKMVEGTPVRDHKLKMMGFLNELDILGAIMDAETQIDIVLASLPGSFNEFVMTYHMNKLTMTLTELLNQLQSTEDLKKINKKSVFLAEDNVPSVSKPKDTGATSHICNVLQGLRISRRLTDGELNLYRLELVQLLQFRLWNVSNIESVPSVDVLNLKRARDTVIPTQLWHLRLGHIGVERITRLVKDGPLDSIQVEPFPTYKSCLQGKMTKIPFKGKSGRSESVLELIHTDVCGPLSHPARGGFVYFVTFTDDHSRYGYLYLMRRKSETLEKFKEFKNEVENQLNRRIKTLRFDRGGEYLSDEFKDCLKEHGITSQWTPPATPELNGVSERRNQTLLDMVRSMMSFAKAPLFL
ncbi:uncharacterized protein LOC143856998 [Tasmannia lanceolata]|uniref:uncharacterized protein LOC143856998 n=1 Tax=Tasmannia lanceolata TaxID=3420 RepID=UPI004063640C